MQKKLLFKSKFCKIYILIIIFLINIKFLNKKKIYFKGVAICVIAKNENLYINEFVDYYKKLGISKIYLYDNNDISGENFSFILKNDIESNFVEIINARGKKKFQVDAYNDCYRNHRNDYSWFLIIDVDEYLYIKNNVSLFNYLNDIKFKNCNNIHINHKMYGDSDLLYYDKRPLSQRFTKNFVYLNFMKTIVRGGLKNAFMWLHRSFFITNYCDSEGNNITPGIVYTKDLKVKRAEFRHYITKTIGEFYIRLLRGWPDMSYGSKRYYEFVEKRIKNFFSLNKLTKKKFDIICPLIKNKKLLHKFIEELKRKHKM